MGGVRAALLMLAVLQYANWSPFLVFGTRGGLDRGTGMERRGFNAIGMTALSALFCSSGEWGCYEHYAGGRWGEYERVACREAGIADRVLIMSGL